jgi:hypothetical protein
MVISAISRERAAERALAEYNNMIQAFAANGANEPFHIGPLPWRPGRRKYLFEDVPGRSLHRKMQCRYWIRGVQLLSST